LKQPEKIKVADNDFSRHSRSRSERQWFLREMNLHSFTVATLDSRTKADPHGMIEMD
jgi:hypothetical protein